jgi:malonyl-CoA O-methyltransferase
MNVRESYDKWAATYDQDDNLTRDLDAVATRAVLDGLDGGTILEIGCGTGKNTEYLARRGRSVHALDFSEGMIALARAKLPLANVTFAVTDLTQRWPVGDRSVDLVVGNLVLEHIRDLSLIFAEAFRALEPGGHFFVCELHPFRQYQGGSARFHHGPTTELIPAFVHHLTDFISAGERPGFALSGVREWWHAEDAGKPPRLVSFLFRKMPA